MLCHTVNCVDFVRFFLVHKNANDLGQSGAICFNYQMEVIKAYGLSNIVSVPDIRRLPALRCHLLLALVGILQIKFSITCVL